MALIKIPKEMGSTPGIVDNSNATAITIDSSENVGIGTSSPTTFSGYVTVHHKNTSGDAIHLIESDGGIIGQTVINDASGVVTMGARSNHPWRVTTNDTERMRIDASGHLMVGTTDTAPGAGDTNAGVSIRGGSDNRSFFSVNGDYVMHLNRNTNDGNILEFSKNGATVGSIASISNDLVIYSSTASHAGLSFGNTRIEPTNNQGVIYNGGIDLGNTDSRFKDIYLSSGANINGVGVVAPSGIRFVVYGSGSGGAGLYFGSGILAPTNNTGGLSDNTVDLGTASFRFNDAFVTNGVTAGSDGNLKQDIEALSDAEQRVAVACKGLLRKFRWIDAVEAKGDDARIHFGIIAQDLQAAFEAEGLDAGRYAMFMSNTWWETQTEVAAVEAVEATEDTEAIEAVDAYTRTDTYDTAEEAPEGATERTRLGIRYSELLAFIISAI